MASSLDFVEFVAGQLAAAGEIRYKKMFGEYGLYCDEKYFAVICDNQFLVKVTPGGDALLPNCPRKMPYEGAKPMLLIEELDDTEMLKKLTTATCLHLPVKKKR